MQSESTGLLESLKGTVARWDSLRERLGREQVRGDLIQQALSDSADSAGASDYFALPPYPSGPGLQAYPGAPVSH